VETEASIAMFTQSNEGKNIMTMLKAQREKAKISMDLEAQKFVERVKNTSPSLVWLVLLPNDKKSTTARIVWEIRNFPYDVTILLMIFLKHGEILDEGWLKFFKKIQEHWKNVSVQIIAPSHEEQKQTAAVLTLTQGMEVIATNWIKEKGSMILNIHYTPASLLKAMQKICLTEICICLQPGNIMKEAREVITAIRAINAEVPITILLLEDVHGKWKEKWVPFMVEMAFTFGGIKISTVTLRKKGHLPTQESEPNEKDPATYFEGMPGWDSIGPPRIFNFEPSKWTH